MPVAPIFELGWVFLMCAMTSVRSSTLAAQYKRGVFSATPPNPRLLKTATRAPIVPAAATKHLMYSDWDAPINDKQHQCLRIVMRKRRCNSAERSGCLPNIINTHLLVLAKLISPVSHLCSRSPSSPRQPHRHRAVSTVRGDISVPAVPGSAANWRKPFGHDSPHTRTLARILIPALAHIAEDMV